MSRPISRTLVGSSLVNGRKHTKDQRDLDPQNAIWTASGGLDRVLVGSTGLFGQHDFRILTARPVHQHASSQHLRNHRTTSLRHRLRGFVAIEGRLLQHPNLDELVILERLIQSTHQPIRDAALANSHDRVEAVAERAKIPSLFSVQLHGGFTLHGLLHPPVSTVKGQSTPSSLPEKLIEA